MGAIYNDGVGGIWLTNVIAVPEPGTVVLLFGGLGALLVSRSRQFVTRKFHA